MTQVRGPAFFILDGAVRKEVPCNKRIRQACLPDRGGIRRLRGGLRPGVERKGGEEPFLPSHQMDIFYLTIVRMSIGVETLICSQYSLNDFAVIEETDKKASSFLIN